MNYPLISEYIEAIKSAEDNFEELNFLRPVLDDEGQPVMSAGGFSVVFKMKDDRKGKLYAVKCFTKEQEGRSESYKLIADELEFVSSAYLTSIKYFENELFVDSSQSSKTEFPVVLMDWVEGIPMDKYIHEKANDQFLLEMLAFRFSKLAMWLLAQPFAHGDLKPDNILIKENGSIVLVDYDGMYVQAMKGKKARELGSPNFRHPSRVEDIFDETIDDFSIALIALALKAFSLNKDLINDYCTNDYFLFKEKDYACLYSCKTMNYILNLVNDKELQSLLGTFMIALANNSLSLVSSKLLSLNNPKFGLSYGEYIYDQARNLCDEAEDKSKIDYKKAFKLFVKAANIGSADAQCCVGCCYKHGYGTNVDYTKAREMYDISAKNGCARALRHIAMCYEDGFGVDNDINKAIEWYKKAIEQDDKTSMVILGKIYYFGRGGVTINYKEAVKWYTMAAEKGDSDGMWRLGNCFKYGNGVDKDFDKTFYWYQNSAEKDNTGGMWRLGNCFFGGEGTKKDYKIAVEWYKKAADKDDYNGILRLGYCYEKGLGVAKNYDEAFVLYQKAADKGSSEGMWRLGNLYEKGFGVAKNFANAFILYQKSADKGNSEGILRLGNFYEKGLGVKQDVKKAKIFYEKAAELGNKEPMELINSFKDDSLPFPEMLYNGITSIPYPEPKESVKRKIKEQFLQVVKDPYYYYLAIINSLIGDECLDSKVIRPQWIPSEINNNLSVKIATKGTNVECTYSKNGIVSSFISKCDIRNIDDVVELSYELLDRLGLVGAFISNGSQAINYINKHNILNDRGFDLPF